MRRKTLVTAITLCLLPIASAWSAEAPLSGHADVGKAIADKCAACHGSDGISTEAGIPHLAGQHQPYLQAALTAYKTGAKKDEKMQPAVAGLSDQDIADVAAYYAGLKSFDARPPEPGQDASLATDQDPFAAVKELAASCGGCHGEDGNSPMPSSPSLAGQHNVYLMAATQAYQDGTRDEAMMKAMTETLSRSQIEDLAYYYAAMVPKRTDAPGSGDPLAGMAIAAPCGSCHGLDGNSADPKSPTLAGLSAEYLIAATNAYKDGTRKHEVMKDQVLALRDQDVADIAAYYASKEPRALPIRKPLTVTEWTARCTRCHGVKGESSDPRFPILAGQDKDYLAKAMELYHRGTRGNELMFAMSFLMTQSDIDKLAAYYARQRKE